MAEVQVIVFAFDRPVSKKRPLHARSNGPANAGLRARSQVERCKDRRGGVTGVDGRRAETRGNVVAKYDGSSVKTLKPLRPQFGTKYDGS